MTILTHRRHEAELSEDGWVILFAEAESLTDESSNYHYGHNCWELNTELPAIEDCQEIAKFASEFYSIDIDEAEELVNPDNIVETAGAWDDFEFVQACWDRFECVGFRTYDGAIVLDRHSVKMTYTNTKKMEEELMEETYALLTAE